MAKKYDKCKVVSNELVATDTYLLEFECNTKNIWPGQFAHIKAFGRSDLLLRRPISVNSVDYEKSTLKLIIQSKGEGTQALCKVKKGEYIDVISPCGKGFLLKKEIKKVAVVGGGIGVAPLKYTIEYYKDIAFDSYIGFRSKEFAYQLDEFKEISSRAYICTDDGSLGTKGFVTSMLDHNIEKKGYDIILACGPKPMLKSLKQVIDKHDVPCLVSLEERMGCGIGICKTCVCKTVKDGEENYERVCMEGPVFEINEVVL